ncbi:Apolipoprotein N-acyltransferase [Coxiella endosymbiont of Amblyomma nuttalli]|nr:Apolipoprotein N-acyltransferase [Coxiella endosymbiont of Amblyomma nuttalli]
MLVLAFSPFGWFPIAFISPAILLAIWLRSRPLQALWQGWIFGVGFFGAGISWVYISIHSFGHTHIPLAVLITILFISVLSSFPAIQGCLFSLFRKKNSILIALFMFPAWWAIYEWLRSELFTGFPWLFLGYSQTNSPLRGFGPIFGVYGISLIVTFISSCLYLLFFHKRIFVKILSVILIILLFIAGGILGMIRWIHLQKISLKVSLVQGNVFQWRKWDIDQLLSILQIYRSETERHWNTDIIVWPEAAIPVYPQQVSTFLKNLDEKAKQHKTALIIGIPICQIKSKKLFNGLIVIGDGQGFYLKRHLVIFGEYTPPFFYAVMKNFDIPLSNLKPGPQYQFPSLAKNMSFAPFICYEITYSREVLANLPRKKFIVVVSDDSWFNGTIASSQQLQIAQMRAIETGRYVLYSTNTGITAIINPQGKIQQSAPENRQIVLSGKIFPVTGKTPLMAWDYYPVIGIIILFLLITFT